MPDRISLAYGHSPLPVVLPKGATVVLPPAAPVPGSLDATLAEALAAPIGSASLENLGAPARRITVVVSDATRAEPRADMLQAVLDRLDPRARLTLAIATGTHGPSELTALGIGALLPAFTEVVNHDGHCDDNLVDVGTTSRGTPVRVHRCVVEADLVVAVGAIKPHYFAGFGAGCKAVFPGLGANREIRLNHELKKDARAVAGRVRDNPCRQDLEEAVRLVPAPVFILNAVLDPEGRAQSAVAGDAQAAFLVGAQRCDPLFRVRAQPTRSIVVSDRLPVSGSVYQASKLVAAVAPIAAPGATIVVVAQCPFGTGPVDTVNHAIYEIGIRPRLPDEHQIVLVSDLTPQQVAPLYCGFAPTIEAALERLDQPPTVFPLAGSLIVEPV